MNTNFHSTSSQLLFGRGLRAGIDMREQKKKSTYVENLEAVRDKVRLA